MGSRDRRQVLLTEDHVPFAHRAGELLRADPVGTNVVATVLAAVVAGRQQPAGSLWALVCDGERPVGAALLTAGWAPFLSPMPDDDAAALADALHRNGHDVPTVRGDAAATQAFAARWCALTGCRAWKSAAQGVHLLDRLVPPGVPGSARAAAQDDTEIVGRWFAAFSREAHEDGAPWDSAAARQHVEMFVARVATGRVMLWTDGDEPVSLAGWQLPDAPAGTVVGRIGPVYTPPDRRRRGYAAGVTAAATQAALDAGASDVMLYTDLANPTSNGVYARLGYRRVGEAASWTFAAPGEPS